MVPDTDTHVHIKYVLNYNHVVNEYVHSLKQSLDIELTCFRQILPVHTCAGMHAKNTCTWIHVNIYIYIYLVYMEMCLLMYLPMCM